MNIDTLLEAAEYVDSGGVVLDQSFTRGRDGIDGQGIRERSHPSPILHKQLSGCTPARPQTKSPTKSPTKSTYEQLPVSSPPVPAVCKPQRVPASNTDISDSASTIQYTPSYHPGSHPAPYHVFAQIPLQNLQQHPQQLPQHHHDQHQPPPHLQHQPQQHAPLEQQHRPISADPNSTPSLPAQPPPLLPTSSAAPQHLVTPQQAIDLLQLAEAQGSKYTMLTPATSTTGEGNSLSGLHGNASPRLVHQIVSHNQWLAGERLTSPKSSPNLKPSAESDSADSATDGSGKDKRAGIREVHNKLEKNRRAHLKECFENLRAAIPNMEDKKSKTSNLSILRGALRYVQVLTRKERELEHELDRLVRQKIETQQRLDLLKIKNGMSTSEPVKVPRDGRDEVDEEEDRLVVVEEKDIVMVTEAKKPDDDDDQASTSTASEAEEEERKSRVQSRSQSPLHQPVTSHHSHAAHTHPGVSPPYHQAFPNYHAPTKPVLPFTSTTPHLTGQSHPANEAMLRISAMRESSESRHPAEGNTRLRHGSGPRTTYLQVGQDKVSALLHNVVSQISPTSTRDSSVLVSQSAGNIARQTVSQLLGKQPVVRQPVRRQLSVSQLPVIQPPMRSHLLPRIMSAPKVRLGFNSTTPSIIGAAKPVVTVGINSLLAKPSVIQTVGSHKTVISNGLMTPTAHLTAGGLLAQPNTSELTTPSLTTPALTSSIPASFITATEAPVPKSLVTASVITQTLPVMSHPGHTPFISPIALQSPTAAATSLLLTHPAPSYIGLPPSMITRPFIGSFPATRPPHIQITTSTQVTPSSATTQPLVHPSVQPIEALSNSAISLALAQASLPKHIQQMSTGAFPSAININSLASPDTALSTSLANGKNNIFANAPSAVIPTSSAPTKAKPLPTPATTKGPRSKLGKSVNGKTEIQITTSKMAETMANVGSGAQTMAKNGQSTATLTSKTTQQSVVLHL